MPLAHLASGDVPVSRSVLPEGLAAVDETVRKMVEIAHSNWGVRSPKIRALAINIINQAGVANKDYYGMIKAVGEWVRDNVRYVRDPIGQETLSYPEELAFNTKAGDCDDMTTLVIALLGSLGIKAYPVVIGTLAPNHYTHVYAHAVVPAPGKHRNAGKIIPIDAIMREWPIGKEAPQDKVKAKKTYPSLAGGPGMLGDIVSAPDYLDKTAAPGQVERALNAKSVDAGGYGQTVQTAPVIIDDGEEADSLFTNPVNTMLPAGSSDLYSYGPVYAATAAGTAHRIPEVRTRDIASARTKPKDLSAYKRKKVVTVRGESPTGAVTVDAQGATSDPSLEGLRGLADLLASIDAQIDMTGASMWSGFAGPADPLVPAAAARFWAANRAGRVRALRERTMRAMAAGVPLAGPDDLAFLSDDLVKAADAVVAKADAVVAKAAKGSPRRRALAQGIQNRLKAHERNHQVGNRLARSLRGARDVRANASAVSALATAAQVPEPVAPDATPLMTEVPGAVVRDRKGRVLSRRDHGMRTPRGRAAMRANWSQVSEALATGLRRPVALPVAGQAQPLPAPQDIPAGAPAPRALRRPRARALPGPKIDGSMPVPTAEGAPPVDEWGPDQMGPAEAGNSPSWTAPAPAEVETEVLSTEDQTEVLNTEAQEFGRFLGADSTTPPSPGSVAAPNSGFPVSWESSGKSKVLWLLGIGALALIASAPGGLFNRKKK